MVRISDAADVGTAYGTVDPATPRRKLRDGGPSGRCSKRHMIELDVAAAASDSNIPMRKNCSRG